MTVSVLIITKNEASTIGQCVAAARRISNDVIVIDNGSTDETANIAMMAGCRLYHEKWYGYGTNKNRASALALYDWILSLDADEVVDDELIAAVKNLNQADVNTMYDMRFKSYYDAKAVRFGTWGRDHHVRLFNRKYTGWTQPLVHETLVRPADANIRKIQGYVHHYSVKSAEQYRSKMIHYARLNARKYLKEGKKTTITKQYLAPLFHFLKSYIFLLGILDGKRGLIIAKIMAEHTWFKYYYLKQETIYRENEYFAKENFSVEY